MRSSAIRLGRRAACIVTLVLMGACGGSDSPAATPEGADGPAAEGDDASQGASSDQAGKDKGHAGDAKGSDGGIPTTCGRQDGDLCLPPNKFVLALCSHAYPSVALKMFSAGTPWSRGYMLHETKAVNASGGGSTGEMVAVDEEVIVVNKRGPSRPGGMEVSGADGSIDVLRWDGSCVTLHPSEVSYDAPSKVRNARIVWNNVESAFRDALKEHESVYEAYKIHKRECKGVSFGDVSKKCVVVDRELSEVIAKHIRENGGLPTPKKLPEL
jgi:hypothetical protein